MRQVQVVGSLAMRMMRPWSNGKIYSTTFTHCLCQRRNDGWTQTRLRLLTTTSLNSISAQSQPTATRYLIHWRGEHKEQYSHSFRRWEWLSALSATVAEKCGLRASDLLKSFRDCSIFTNAFSYDPYQRNDQLPSSVTLSQVEMYNQALQYVHFTNNGVDSGLSNGITPEILARAAERCSLINAAYLVLADGSSYPELVDRSLQSISFNDMIKNETTATWRVRRHEFSFADDDNNPRFGKNTTRSVPKERAALPHLKEVLVQFGGKVDLKKPECDIYLFEGLSDNILGANTQRNNLFKILARRLTEGATHSIMAPKTRICITKTPLCSIAAYILANVAMVQEHQTILDPFAGSAATLLAASLISPTVRTVGIEIAKDESISKSNIREDFISRGVAEPVALLEGDVMDHITRDKARAAIGTAFDVIITDPPYGRREALSGVGVGNDNCEALNDLIDVIGQDRKRGRPLLRPGGQLVAFLPCPKGSNIMDLLPSRERLAFACLELKEKRKQKLNDSSRWVLSFVSQDNPVN